MRSYVIGFSALVLILGASGVVEAGRINTPPITVDFSGDLACVVTNVTKKTIGPLTVTVFDGNGMIAEAAEITTLDANVSRGVLAGLVFDVGFCRVEGSGVSKRKTPVTLCAVVPGTTSRCGAAVSVP